MLKLSNSCMTTYCKTMFQFNYNCFSRFGTKPGRRCGTKKGRHFDLIIRSNFAFKLFLHLPQLFIFESKMSLIFSKVIQCVLIMYNTCKSIKMKITWSKNHCLYYYHKHDIKVEQNKSQERSWASSHKINPKLQKLK